MDNRDDKSNPHRRIDELLNSIGNTQRESADNNSSVEQERGSILHSVDNDNPQGTKDADSPVKKKLSRSKKAIIGVSLTLVFLVVFVVGGFQILKAVGKANLRKAAESDRPDMGTEGVSDEELGQGVVYYNGQKYKYNDSIVTVLCMGIDTDGMEERPEQGFMGYAGQADSIFLMALDERNNKMSLIAVSRDTMAEINVLDMFGKQYTTKRTQLALQYAYGDGKERSGKEMVSTVSKLMYNLPIHAYAAIKLEAVSTLNDALGGITVTVPSDDKDFLEISGYTPGQTVTLKGNKAVQYVRSRNIKTFASNSQRIARQKQYMIGFVNTFKEKVAKNISLPVEMYKAVTENLNTDISLDKASYIGSLVAGMSFSEDQLHIVKGKVEQGEVYEEYVVDDDALYQLIINVFYEKIEDNAGQTTQLIQTDN